MKDKNMLMQLSDKIYTLRKNAGLSQEQLAEKLDVSRQAVSKWEIGSAAPELDNVVAIAKLFNVTCDWLLMDDAKRVPEDKRNTEAKSEIQTATEKNEKKRFFLHEDQWRMCGMPFLLSFVSIAFGCLLRLLINWIFYTIFGSLQDLTGASKIVYVILSAGGMFFIGVGIFAIVISLIGFIYFIVHNRRNSSINNGTAYP